jgi:hypothetical protein
MNITSDVAAFLGVAMADAKATNFAEIWCPVMGSVTADVPQTLNESWARHCGPFMAPFGHAPAPTNVRYRG